MDKPNNKVETSFKVFGIQVGGNPNVQNQGQTVPDAAGGAELVNIAVVPGQKQDKAYKCCFLNVKQGIACITIFELVGLFFFIYFGVRATLYIDMAKDVKYITQMMDTQPLKDVYEYIKEKEDTYSDTQFELWTEIGTLGSEGKHVRVSCSNGKCQRLNDDGEVCETRQLCPYTGKQFFYYTWVNNTYVDLTKGNCKQNSNAKSTVADLVANTTQTVQIDGKTVLVYSSQLKQNKRPTNFQEMKLACENQLFVQQCKVQLKIYQDWLTTLDENSDIKETVPCDLEVYTYMQWIWYSFAFCQLPRLYALFKQIKWLAKDSKRDEARDRYALVLGFTSLAIHLFCDILVPIFVGFYFGVSSSLWNWPITLLILNLFVVLYFRYAMIQYYQAKDQELAQELELEEFNLNNKPPSISNVSFSSTAALVGGNGQGNISRI